MATYTKSVDGKELVVHCDRSLEPLARRLLDQIAQLSEKGKGLADGVTIQTGWSTLRLKADGSKLVVNEPDFDRNPLRSTKPDVTHTLKVMSDQQHVLDRMHEKGDPAHFNEKVVAKNGVLTEDQIYLERIKTKSRGDSGWYIGPLEDADGEKKMPSPDELEAISVYRLLKLRPAVLQVMALPPGYLAVFSGDDLVSVIDEKGEMTAWDEAEDVSKVNGRQSSDRHSN